MNFNNIDKTFINISGQGDVPASDFYIIANSAQHQDIISFNRNQITQKNCSRCK